MIKTLYKGKWLTVKERNGWEFIHEHRCSGRGVAILPFRWVKTKSGFSLEFLLRVELIPSWNDQPVPCSISGMMDVEGEPSRITAARELAEETGYHVDPSDLITEGTSRVSKASDTLLDLYTVNLTYVKQGEKPKADDPGEIIWTPKPLDLSDDPILGLLFARFDL